MAITIYSKPQCVQCDATKRFLKKHDLEFEELAIADHPDVLEEARAEGWSAAPICVTDQGVMWAGMNPGRLQAYKAVEEYRRSFGDGVDSLDIAG